MRPLPLQVDQIAATDKLRPKLQIECSCCGAPGAPLCGGRFGGAESVLRCSRVAARREDSTPECLARFEWRSRQRALCVQYTHS